MVTKFASLQEAIDYVLEHVNDGVVCPCCNQLVKTYRGKLNDGMAKTLLGIYIITCRKKSGWVHVNKDIVKGHSGLPQAIRDGASNRDYSLLRFWKLIEERPAEHGRKNSGEWRITRLGVQFIRSEIKVPEAVFVLNNECVGVSHKLIGIDEAIEQRFDFEELMTS